MSDNSIKKKLLWVYHTISRGKLGLQFLWYSNVLAMK